MATLNLSKMKYMSETNLKKFASLIISLPSQVTDIENKCIKPYVGGELYPRDSYVSYNGYIYQATTTNQDSAFNETHWDKLSDDFNELTVADIEAMLGLSREQLETMANLIADTEIRLDKTYSSSKIYQDIQQCLNDSKSYTLKEIAKLNGSSYKVVTSTSEMTSESIIYLLASGNTYDMYIVEEDGATTKIGNMDVNLDNYFTKAEIEADYLKKADADGKYATTTTVDGKVDKTDIVDNLTSIDIDKPLSANQGKVLKDEVDLKANDSEVVKKTDIATTLDNTVTDEQVASALLTKTELDKVNASLGELSDSLVDKQDFRVFKSLEEFNEKKGTSFTVVSGVDNMADIISAMIEGDMLIITTNYITGSEIYFGLDSSTGWTKMFKLTRIGGLCDIKCVTSAEKNLTRVLAGSTLTSWQKIATQKDLDELFQSVSDGKTLVANAITDKGVSTATDATFATMATNISKISGGYKEETKSYYNTSSGANRLVFTFSADVSGVKQVTPPSDASSYIVPETTTSMFTVDGKKLTLYVNGIGAWKVTALIES